LEASRGPLPFLSMSTSGREPLQQQREVGWRPRQRTERGRR